MNQPVICPKCHHARGKDEHAPAWRCPRCGVVYEKFTAPRAASSGLEKSTEGRAPRGRFKTLRVTVLLFILFMAGADALLTKLRTTSWDHPLRVVIYPINADGSAAAARYIAGLDTARFDGVEELVKSEAARYGVNISEPMRIDLAAPVAEAPPLPPRDRNVPAVMWWSLKLRLWANGADHYDGPAPEVRAFALYYDPATHPVLRHSTGLEKGMIALIHLFASEQMTARNDTVLLHELLHTLGATDKYDSQTNQPLYPNGYAEPDLQPPLPQRKAEVMAGRIPVSRTHANETARLNDVIVGEKTAREIGWIK